MQQSHQPHYVSTTSSIETTWIWEHPNWPAFTWDDRTLMPLLASARLAQGRVLGTMHTLDAGMSSEAMASILVENGLTTSAIEGERLDVGAVRSSAMRRLGLSTVGLPKPPRDVEGLIEVLLDAVQHYDQPLTKARLLGWQAALFPTGYAGLQAIRTGALRGNAPMQVVSGRIGRELVHFQAPPKQGLEERLNAFLQWLNTPRLTNSTTLGMDGLLRAGVAHLWFITLHPFEDGNGRVARAITDMTLSQDECQPMRFFSLSAQILREREAYYTMLERTQRGALDITPWLAWFLVQVREAASAAQATVAQTLNRAKFWLKHQQTDLNPHQRKVLNRMLDTRLNEVQASKQQGDLATQMNTRKYAALAGISRVSAYRELRDLVNKGCLAANAGGGRSSSYRVVVSLEN